MNCFHVRIETLTVAGTMRTNGALESRSKARTLDPNMPFEVFF